MSGTFRRPMSFSESHIQLPRIVSKERALILEDIGLPLEESSSSTNLRVEQQEVVQTDVGCRIPPHPPWYDVGHIWAIRFIFHIVLISLFETLFFWFFISRTEDAALITLVNSYTKGLFDTCRNMTKEERVVVLDILNLFINSTIIDEEGNSAEIVRNSFNLQLLRNSWLYFGGGVGLFGGIAGMAKWRGLKVEWKQIIIENIALVTMLGIYELMFFSTVVLPYQAITPDELNRMVFNRIEDVC